jgi:AcrR family transcriptional regulator
LDRAGPVGRVRRNRAQAREDNRRALLAAARELIVDVGYANAQLDEIAARAGLTKGAVYSIFGGKLELLRAVVDEHAREMLPLLDVRFDLPSSVTAEDLVHDLATAYLKLLDSLDARRLLAFEYDLTGLALRDEATMTIALAHERAMVERLTAALTGRARRRGSPLGAEQARVTADLVLGALTGVGQRLVTAPWMSPDPSTIAAAMVRLLPDGGN